MNPAEVVIDASVALRLALREPGWEIAQTLIDRCVASDVRMIAPPLFESETDGGVRWQASRSRLTQAAASDAYLSLDDLPIEIIHDPRVRQRARDIAERFNLERVYDATYAAIAELRDCEFWTADQRFADAVRPELTHVRYLLDLEG